MKKYSLGALVAAGLLVGGLSAGSASAADLGGNCCADLEERIAELEATTARKGNRKVSLTVSGWVAEQVMWWDDGAEQNVYVTRSRHHAGLALQVHRPGDDLSWLVCWLCDPRRSQRLSSRRLNQDLQHNTSGSVLRSLRHTVLQSFWFVKSDHLGKLCVGCSRRLRTTRPSSLTVRARSFPPTG